jgi:hypothetical protein
MTTVAINMAAMVMLIGLGGCATYVVPTHQVYDPVDGVQQYTQRSDTITLSAGNAQDVNTRVQETDPWPRNVGNKRIAVNGERMANAVNRYRHQGPRPLPLERTSTAVSGGVAGGGASAGGGGAPASP